MSNAFEIKKQIGELVWIPANTPLMCSEPKEQYEMFHNYEEKKEPYYGLVMSEDSESFKVLVGNEQFYVQKKLVYGV